MNVCWKKRCLVIGLVTVTIPGALAGLEPIDLPAPSRTGGRPLQEVLRDRQSTKAFDSAPLSRRELSNLLWAAFGINRPDSGKRTAASAFDCRDITVYVVLAEGAYAYDASANRLVPAATGDLRPLAATQAYARQAPVQLVYVSDHGKIDDRHRDRKAFYAAFHAGAISQNVYLYCASAGLACVVRDSLDRPALVQALDLGPDFHVVIAQTVGFAPVDTDNPVGGASR